MKKVSYQSNNEVSTYVSKYGTKSVTKQQSN